MEKISDIKISHRLFLLVTIPTIFIIALVSNSLYYQSKISIQMSEIEELASFSPTLTNIVHELQKERGASAGFLGAGGQKIFSEKLAAQRVLTDKTRADLDYRLQSINMTSHDKGFSTLLQAALDQLKKLESAREAVSTRKLAVSDMARYYTRTIARLLETVAFMTHLSPDPELAIQIDAYESLLQAKERAGLERAIGSNSFTKGAFAPSIYREFAVLIAEQHVFIDKFKQLSSPEIVTFYEKKMMDPAIARLDAMRDTALNSVFSSPKAITAIKGTLWFDTITKKIDILKEVEAHISAKIITLAEHKSQEATTSLVSIATILFMVLAVTVSLALLIAHSISYPINKISRHMRLMAERDFQGKLNLRESSDEIGNIIQAVSCFQSKTRQAQQIEEQAKTELARTHEHLKASVDSMRNGLAIWSADDRLVLANSAYKNFFPSIKELIVKGARFEDIQLAAYDKGTWSVSDKNRQAWLDQQLEKRRTTRQWEYELVLADGKPLVFDESLLDNDEVITTIVDISSHRDRELELKNTKSELEQIAYFDNLTGLGNRAHCQKDLAEKYAFLTPGSKFAIIIIDLDKFKRVNDTLGHAAGDHLLKTIGQRFKQFSAELNGIEVYRWGGDEFIALLDRSENTDIGSICEELTDIGSVPLSFDDKILRPTVSLGVARYPEDGEDLQALMIFSDLALYKTKELGRDGYQFFTSDMKATIDRETRIEDELWVAIEKGQLELYYQPQISAKDESITGFEALLRWNHPERGLIPPGDFLPISEVTGLARIIGCHVFDQAAKTIRAWLDEGIEFGRLSVNLSPQHLKESLFLADLFGALDRHNVEPHHLVVEILETFLLDDPHANVKSTLKKIREHGIEVELDDFGTGYASLSHLSSMPISGIKIDRSFIQQITTDPKQRGIVSSLISISNVMELRIVCEGIELQEQVEAISSLSNCSLQGYFIARPMTLEDTSDWIRNEQNKGLVRDFPSIQLSNAS